MKLTQAQLRDLCALTTSKGRSEQNAFLVEGEKSVQEALKASWRVRMLVVDRERSEFSAPTYLATPEQMKRISTMSTPPGFVAVVEKPTPVESKPIGTVLALDGVADPGNLGTIIRTADWFGVQEILLSPACVDPYNEKVVRASMGSLFHVRLRESTDLLVDLTNLQQAGYALVVSDVHAGSTALPSKKPICLVMGSESHGVRAEVAALADCRYTIAGSGQAESLNVAVSTGILLYRLTQPHG